MKKVIVVVIECGGKYLSHELFDSREEADGYIDQVLEDTDFAYILGVTGEDLQITGSVPGGQ